MGFLIPAGLALSFAMIFTSGIDMVLDQDSLVPMGVFVGGVILVTTVVWKAASRVTLIVSRLDRLEDDSREMKKKIERGIKDVKDKIEKEFE